MKKFLSLTLALVLTASAFAVMPVLAASFSDVPETHWAYQSVSKLSEEGTVNGYSDGTFAPDGTVTRAEFVKMLGKSETKRDADFADVDPSHWCYDYIMYSGLEGNDKNNFCPDEPIKRSDCANLLYKRFANGADAIAPYSISSQGSNPKATAWVYSSGLMLGDDMLNLRLDDTITRAEAAVLIVRAQTLDLSAERNFIDNFSNDVYKAVYNGSNLFDTEYDANGNISNGEMAAAALRFQFRSKNIPLGNYIYEKKYDGEYAAEWNIMSRYALESGKYTSSEAESKANATVGDAIAMLSYALMADRYVGAPIKPTGDVYPEITIADKESGYAKALGYAYDFGISLYAGKKINPSAAITKRELACIVMQYDLVFGANVDYRCGYECTHVPMPVSADVNNYPANASDYTAILGGVPNSVYEAEFNNGNVIKKGREFTDTAVSLSALFVVPLNSVCADAYEKGIELYINFMPSLMAVTDTGIIYRTKLEFTTAPNGAKLSDVFKLSEGVQDVSVKSGDSVWIDLNTNAKISGLYIDSQLMTVDRVILQ